MPKTVERRNVLRAASAAGAAAVAGLAVTDSARADDAEVGDPVIGAWVVTHRDDPPGPPNVGKSVVTAALGGAFENVEIAPATGVGAGAWRGLGDGRFHSVFLTGGAGSPCCPGGSCTCPTGSCTCCKCPKAGDPDVIVELRPRGRVHGNTMSGTYTVSGSNAETGVVLFSGTGTFTGTRLTP